MAKNPFEAMAKFYEKCVKEQDDKGFAEVFKNSTTLLFERINKELNRELHFEDVSFLDGYFIFGHGTNSVVHFHIKEAPGWRGGIWWSPVTTEETKDKKKPTYETNKLHCELFFQFEKEIDKFKPSASMFGGSFDLYFEEGHGHSGFLDACWDLKFIIDEPYLAFYKEMHYSNFNHEYVSRESAKRYWVKHWKEKDKEKEIDHINAQAMYDTFKYIIGPSVKDGDAFILDQGAYLSPRYEVVLRNPKLKDGKYWVEKDGCYYLFEGYTDAKKDERLFNKTKKECAKRSKYNFYYYNPFSTFAFIVRKPRFTKLLKEAIAENRALYYKKDDGTIYEGQVASHFDIDEDDE